MNNNVSFTGGVFLQNKHFWYILDISLIFLYIQEFECRTFKCKANRIFLDNFIAVFTSTSEHSSHHCHHALTTSLYLLDKYLSAWVSRTFQTKHFVSSENLSANSQTRWKGSEHYWPSITVHLFKLLDQTLIVQHGYKILVTILTYATFDQFALIRPCLQSQHKLW